MRDTKIVPKFECKYLRIEGSSQRLTIEAEDEVQAYTDYLARVGKELYPVVVVKKGLINDREYHFSNHYKKSDTDSDEILNENDINEEESSVETSNDSESALEKEIDNSYIKFYCSSCGQKIGLPLNYKNNFIFCPSCGEKTQIPLGLRQCEELAIVPKDDNSSLSETKDSTTKTKVPNCIYVIGILRILLGFCGGVSFPINMLMQNIHFLDGLSFILSVLIFYYGICLIMLKGNSRLYTIRLLNFEIVLIGIGCFLMLAVTGLMQSEGISYDEMKAARLLVVIISIAGVAINMLFKHLLNDANVKAAFENEYRNSIYIPSNSFQSKYKNLMWVFVIIFIIMLFVVFLRDPP